MHRRGPVEEKGLRAARLVFQAQTGSQERARWMWFSLKGSPRHYDDVKRIIESDPGARVYFSEALTYERGAGVALSRIEATSFAWLTRLYDWWAEMERVEPIRFTLFLYLPGSIRHAELDLRTHTPDEVVDVIKSKAPRSAEAANRARPARLGAPLLTHWYFSNCLRLANQQTSERPGECAPGRFRSVRDSG